MLSTRISSPVMRSRVPAVPRAAVDNGIAMSTFGANGQLGAHKATATDATYAQGGHTAWSPPV